MGPAGVQRRKPQKGFPARAHGALASGGERGSGAREDTRLGGRRSGPGCGRGSRAGRRGAPGWTPAGIDPWADAAPRASEAKRRRRRVTPGAGGRAAGAAGKAVCGHVVRYVPRARAARRSRATSKPGRAARSPSPRRGSPFARPPGVRRAPLRADRAERLRGPAASGLHRPRRALPASREPRGGGRPGRFPKPLSAFARGGPATTRSGRSRGALPPPTVCRDPFCLAREQNRPGH